MSIKREHETPKLAIAPRNALCPSCGHRADSRPRRPSLLRKVLGLSPAAAQCGQDDLESDAGWGALPCGCTDAVHGS